MIKMWKDAASNSKKKTITGMANQKYFIVDLTVYLGLNIDTKTWISFS